MTGPRRRPGSARLVTDALDAFMPRSANVPAVIAAWNQQRLAEVPVGRAWDVIRMERPRGWRTLSALRTAGAEAGPILHGDAHVDVFVPLGSADDWDQDGAELVAHGELLLVPPPSVVAPHTLAARSWLVPPRGATLTDATALYEAYAAAGASMAMDGTR